VAQEVPRQ